MNGFLPNQTWKNLRIRNHSMAGFFNNWGVYIRNRVRFSLHHLAFRFDTIEDLLLVSALIMPIFWIMILAITVRPRHEFIEMPES